MEIDDLIEGSGGEKGNIKAENVRFKVAKDSIEAVEGATSGLIIEEGSTLKFTLRDPIKVKGFSICTSYNRDHPQGTYSGSYKAEIESSLE